MEDPLPVAFRERVLKSIQSQGWSDVVVVDSEHLRLSADDDPDDIVSALVRPIVEVT